MSYLTQLQNLIDQKNTIGIDVSAYQGTIDYQDLIVKQPFVSFVCAKASEGFYTDQKFDMNFQNAFAAGLIVGAYHFFNEAVDPIKQAELFYSKAKQSQFIALDYELRKVNQSIADKSFLTFAEKVKQLFHMNPFIYTYPSFEHFPKEFAQYKPWIACYSPSLTKPPVVAPWQETKLWQFAGTDANIKLPNGLISDYDVFMGPSDEFAAYIDQQIITA
jgi:lysozyme